MNRDFSSSEANLRIGVDVGGTNTDAVLMHDSRIVASAKKTTTLDVSKGIVDAVSAVLADSNTKPEQINCVMVGTTHFTNAFVERKKLQPVAAVRICLPAARGIPPLLAWPEDLLSKIGNHKYLIQGGYQFDGRLNSTLDERELVTVARDIRKKNIKSVAITALFSQINGDMELRAEEIIYNEIDNVAITLSHKVGRGGILERENAAVMNASLADLSHIVVDSFRDAFKSLKIKAQLYISQNDGTLMDAENVKKYPILTFASGPTNSMRGAAYLSGLKNALVADIGGTTTDIGVLANGFPRESSVNVDIGGVRTNFRMPDILSLGLGGGSIVTTSNNAINIGPESIGYQLLEKGLIFGGDTFTASDVAVAMGCADFGDKSLVKHLSPQLIAKAVVKLHQMLADGIDKMKSNAENIPLILVGGGSILISNEIAGVCKIITPDNADVANAIGASIAQVCGEVDTVIAYNNVARDSALKMVKEQATEKAIKAGATKESIIVLDIDETPLAYAPDGSVRLRVKVAGDLKIDSINI